jgi:hypothetical protein
MSQLMDGHLDYCHLGAIMCTAMSNHVQVDMYVFIFIIVGSMVDRIMTPRERQVANWLTLSKQDFLDYFYIISP